MIYWQVQVRVRIHQVELTRLPMSISTLAANFATTHDDNMKF